MTWFAAGWRMPCSECSEPVEVASSPANPSMSPQEFRLLQELINQHAGILISADLLPMVARRLRDRLSALRLGSYRDYYQFLRYHPRRQAELERAMELLTTNETYFFRELPQLRAFTAEVLPQVRQTAATRKSLTIWSAGCSTGEEVYTLAMLIDESALFEGWHVRVFGNDISRQVLQVARRGEYRESSFRAMPHGYDRYFTATPGGRMVHPRIRAMCAFGHFNLLDDARVAIVGAVDVIFCRNVLIYFDQASRRRLIDSFHTCLHPGGYLMLGHSESLLSVSTAFELANLRGDLAYRKSVHAEPARRAVAGGGVHSA